MTITLKDFVESGTLLRTPLHYAAASGRAEHVRLLLSASRLAIKVDERDVLGRTALMWAAMLPGDAGMC